VTDFQRQRVYDAEGVLRQIYDWAVQNANPAVSIAGVPLVLPPEVKFASVASVQSYCDRATQLIGTTPVTVRARKGAAKAHYEPATRTIAVPEHREGNWAMRELVVLHELAHHVAPGAQHGPAFASAFIDVLSTVMGPSAGLALRLVFADCGVKEGVSA